MGTDGPALISDDTAADVRDAYRDALAHGRTDDDAEAAALREFADEDQVVVVLALAVTESTMGRLGDDLRARALTMLDAGGDLDRWAEAGPAAVRRRAAALAKVRAQIEGPQPARRTVRRRRLPTPTVGVGQVLAHRDGRGRVHLLRVVGAAADTCGAEVHVRVLDHEGTDVPDDVTAIPARTRRPPWKKVHIRIIDDTPARRAAAGVVEVGPAPDPVPGAADTVGAVAMDWAGLVSYLDSRPPTETDT
ncbi:hypothetical protein [Alloactinosynnema sp. L-07]|uniref:hypothetical protein n=1 Tax=Alloactinosynnema sp. L-07 TaxID=1653480 RepID=UPI00065F0A0B|nr:hypothetical protein [Alloactinosynnema sp. L-07]CRK57151.1 hypothetical protein [Alloactinosynnema sp. L-07]